MKKEIPVGISIFSFLIILDASFQLFVKLFGTQYYDWYSRIFGFMPERDIFVRYIFSIIFRILELIVGVGLLLRIELIRKFGIGLGWFTIGIVYWKHPFGAICRHSQEVFENLFLLTNNSVFTKISVSVIKDINLGALMVIYEIDIGFAALAIFYFTRPYIKEHFSDIKLRNLFNRDSKHDE